MTKFINLKKCKKCGKCIAGCPNRAKWTAMDFLDQALRHGATIQYNTIAQRLLIKHGRVNGVLVTTPQGEKTILANTVILSAGALESPLVLNRSGIKEAGSNLFLDLFINTYGEADGSNQLDEPIMTMVNNEFPPTKGFIISAFVNRWKIGRYTELGKEGLLLNDNQVIGLMTKIADS